MSHYLNTMVVYFQSLHLFQMEFSHLYQIPESFQQPYDSHWYKADGNYLPERKLDGIHLYI